MMKHQRTTPLIQKINSDKGRLLHELKSIGVDPYAYRLFEKGTSCNLKLSSLTCAQANILKQEAIASGIDAAVAKGTINCSIDATDALIVGSLSGVQKLAKRLKRQPFKLADISNKIEDIIQQTIPPQLTARGFSFDCQSPLIMGILNVTPDSFSDGGQFMHVDQLKSKLSEFNQCNVNIVDIGGESSRPGAESISVSEEIERIKPAVNMALDKGFCVSVDTCKPDVANYALQAGVHIINDVTGLENSTDIATLCAEYDAGLCLMHMQGSPSTMQINPLYDNIIYEICSFFDTAISKALVAGVKERNIILDPGFGFGKTLQDNYYILKNINEFNVFGLPILAGVSRKSMIGKVTDEDEQNRVTSSKIIETLALNNGANIIRTHDVIEASNMVKLFQNYTGEAKRA